MVGEVRNPIPCKPGQPARIDDEYIRNGVVEIFVEVEPLAGKRHVTITEHRTKKDWALQIKQMLNKRYANAIQVRLVMDNLNTHNIYSLYDAFEPAEARLLAKLPGYSLHTEAWSLVEYGRNRAQRSKKTVSERSYSRHAHHASASCRMKKISWQFKTSDAHMKLKRLYPNL